MSKRNLSRRNFLKSASGATAAALSSSAVTCTRPGPAQAECGSTWEQPPHQQGNNLNLILLVNDTFRRDNLECYGSQWVECPNLNRFAQEAIIFEDAYPEGLPTIPFRRTLWRGQESNRGRGEVTSTRPYGAGMPR